MSTREADGVMEGLKGFQRDAVEHVIDRFYGAGRTSGSGRFLVADETGLGKSIIARGVIAKAIEHLETDAAVDRIDVVYVCSNRDLAQQNLSRLNVTGEDHIAMTTRLSLLALEGHRLDKRGKDGRKRVNLVSFTPGTSFNDRGWQLGTADERALICLILDQMVNKTPSDRRVTRMLLRGMVTSTRRFDESYVRPLTRDHADSLDQRIIESFHRAILADGSLEQFVTLRNEARYLSTLTDALHRRAAQLIGRLRRTLAKSGVNSLEPDLVILDEFQRFRHLLDPESGEAAELAHSLFDYPLAKVLLLSATPYKPFTQAGEDDEEHYRDFLSTVRFLAGGEPDAADGVASALASYRRSLVHGDAMGAAALAAREALISLMSRSERPQLAEERDLLAIRDLDGGVPTPADLADWAALQRLGRELNVPIDLEYWKSIPYFASFMEGYKAAGAVRERLQGDDPGPIERALADARSLTATDIEEFHAVDLGNGYLRSLNTRTVGAGWWRLLWVPPSMPYLEPGPVFQGFSHQEVTKQVIFSAWSGAPTAVAALLSYEADRCIATNSDVWTSNGGEPSRAVPPRLTYALREGAASRMSTLAMFWPHPGLARMADPLDLARSAGGRMSAGEALAAVRARLSVRPPKEDTSSDEGSTWAAYFSTTGALPDDLLGLDAASLTIDMSDDGEAGPGAGFTEHVREALERLGGQSAFHPDLPALALNAPGNIAWRALRSVEGSRVSDGGRWRAALVLANGLRALFNRPESIALLTGLDGSGRDRPYWRLVLDYCADGNLQSVLDEFLFQLRSELGGDTRSGSSAGLNSGDQDDDVLAALAAAAVRALTIRQVNYLAHDTTREQKRIPIRARFALRYGGLHATDSSDTAGARQSDVRGAFNSPFAPFVLASTSEGQEGIDFHWWSHSVVHWNLPSNPVDFEQREGRVNRFAGHAVRKNVATAHWADVLSASGSGPWSVAFDAASRRDVGLGEFAPWWVYPGPARIERVVASYPLSRDHARYQQLRDSLTLYRLTLGQPRQEDMIELLHKAGVDGDDVPTIDLRPPRA